MKQIIIIAMVLSFYSCHQKVELEDCMSDVNFSFLNGLKSDMDNDKAYELLGEPDEEIYDDHPYESGYDLYYYNEGGTIIVHTSDVISRLGLIEYIPDSPLYLKDIVSFDIEVKDDTIDFTCEGDMKFEVYLNSANNNSSIEKIWYWWD